MSNPEPPYSIESQVRADLGFASGVVVGGNLREPADQRAVFACVVPKQLSCLTLGGRETRTHSRAEGPNQPLDPPQCRERLRAGWKWASMQPGVIGARVAEYPAGWCRDSVGQRPDWEDVRCPARYNGGGFPDMLRWQWRGDRGGAHQARMWRPSGAMQRPRAGDLSVARQSYRKRCSALARRFSVDRSAVS
jgi:hypothetical protein